MSKRKKDDYEVGYGKPPRHSRFKPGQSGNPKGRPRGAKNVDALLRAALYQKVQITRDGRRVKVPAIEAVFLRITRGGLEGDPRSIAHLIKLMTLLISLEQQEAAGPAEGREAQPGRQAGKTEREILQHFSELLREGALLEADPVEEEDQ